MPSRLRITQASSKLSVNPGFHGPQVSSKSVNVARADCHALIAARFGLATLDRGSTAVSSWHSLDLKIMYKGGFNPK